MSCCSMASGRMSGPGCGCRVEPILAQTEVRTSAPSAQGWPAPVATQAHAIGHHIVYCPLHAAAERLAELARDLIEAMDGAPVTSVEAFAAAVRDRPLGPRARALLEEIGRRAYLDVPADVSFAPLDAPR